MLMKGEKTLTRHLHPLASVTRLCILLAQPVEQKTRVKPNKQTKITLE